MTPADRILVVVALTVIAIFAYTTWKPTTFADRVQISTPYEQKIVSLDQEKTLFITGTLGQAEIRIDHGRVRFIESPCNTQFCVHQGWASHTDDIRACLPNRVSLRLLGNKSAFDSVTF